MDLTCISSDSVISFPSGTGFAEAQNNRDFVVRKMSDEIHEIIRVLQLTTYDEEEWDADDLTVMKKAQVKKKKMENNSHSCSNCI